MAEVEVHDRPERSRYEITVDGRLAGFADYHTSGDTVVFRHTEIDDAMQGRGLANQLILAALDDVRSSGRTVVARCPYVAEFIDEHPEYADLLG
jgi:hypothetical protein